jgi:hypothetical protein
MLGLILSLLLSVFGSDSSPRHIVIDTTSLGPNGAQVLYADEGKVRVTVTRNGEVRRIRVERAGPLVVPTGADEYVVEPVDGQLRASMVKGQPKFIVPPSRILVDGVALDGALPQKDAPPPSPRRKSWGTRYFICPSDETMVRVTVAKEVGELTCPVDGTPMRETAGRQREYYLLQ